MYYLCIYNTKQWLSFRVVLVTTPLYYSATPLMLCQVCVVNIRELLCSYHTFHINFNSFVTNFGHFDQSDIHFAS